VRQAIAIAINKQEIVKAFWGEMGKSDPHFTPPSLEEFQSDTVVDYQYNPQQAKLLISWLQMALTFSFGICRLATTPNPKPIAEAFAAELSAIGIK